MKQKQNEFSKNRLVGRAGELRVGSELLLRGINFAEVEVDSGIDLVLIPSLLRVQVKVSHSEFSNSRGYKYPAYLFNLRHKRYVSSKGVTLRPKLKKSKLDFLILWCIDHDWFYVIPIKEVVQTQINIPIDPKRESKYEQFKDAWNLLQEN